MGGLLNRGSSSGNRRPLSGRRIRIHGQPYRFNWKLGSGGFGSVYAARAPNGSDVAVKVIEINGMPEIGATLVQSYLNEVRHLQRLGTRTNYVVQIFDFDFDPRSGRAYIVMELGDENLGKLIERSHSTFSGAGGPGLFTPPAIRKEIWRQMVGIIGTLHANNTVHMDLKPENFLVFGRALKIADLGISKKAHVPGEGGVGTPFFSAPEVIRDVLGARRVYGPKADVWSLGAILYFMTYGRPPIYSPRASKPPPGQAPARDPLLIDLLRRTLVLDPRKRADTNTISRHPYTLR